MKYVIYLRVSTDEQDVRTQEHQCLQHLVQREKGNNFKHVIYSDPDTSSMVKIEKRLGLQNALQDLKANDVFVVIRLDRIARKIEEVVNVYAEIKKKKAMLLSITQPGIENDVLFGCLAGMASEERKFISRRTAEKLQAKKARGERVGRIPYGYQLSADGVHIEPCQKEQEALALMAQLRSEGASYREIERRLDELGIRNREGNKFLNRNILGILHNRALDCKYIAPIPKVAEFELSPQCV